MSTFQLSFASIWHNRLTSPITWLCRQPQHLWVPQPILSLTAPPAFPQYAEHGAHNPSPSTTMVPMPHQTGVHPSVPAPLSAAGLPQHNYQQTLPTGPLASGTPTRDDQVAMIRHYFEQGIDDHMIAGISMLLAQYALRESRQDLALTIQADVGGVSRTATFHQGEWRGHDLTHNALDARANNSWISVSSHASDAFVLRLVLPPPPTCPSHDARWFDPQSAQFWPSCQLRNLKHSRYNGLQSLSRLRLRL